MQMVHVYDLFLFTFVVFEAKFYSGIRSWIVGAECKQVDHLTTILTYMPILFNYFTKLHCFSVYILVLGQSLINQRNTT